MDTTGAHINGTATPKEKGSEFFKDELAAMLKFGAQNMYKTDDSAQNKKLDEMNLDDILTKADEFDTDAAAQPGTTSLGGAQFLSQFADIQDVKNDMDEDLAWDDIIPVEERVKLDEEESRALQAEEVASANKRRAAARAPGTYEDMDHDDAGSSKLGSPKSGEKKKKGGGAVAPRKSSAQKALDLKGEYIIGEEGFS
jgi:chromodomain-helicase-DNA-binding protein 1